MKKNDKDIYDLELHESLKINTGFQDMTILRVPGGWIYFLDMPGYKNATATFVELHNGFQVPWTQNDG